MCKYTKLLIFILCLIAIPAQAQNTSITYQQVQDSLEVQVYFILSKTNIELDYMDNGKHLRKFIDEFQNIKSDPTYKISSFDVTAGASPEGYHSTNIELSQNRANALIKYLENYVSLSDLTINVQSLGSDWQGFRAMILNSQLPGPTKNKVLEIIDSAPSIVSVNGKETDSRLIALKELDNGTPYKYIETFIFPQLREAYASVKIKFERAVEVKEAETAVAVVPAPAAPQAPVVEKIDTTKLPLYRFMLRNDIEKYKYYKRILAFRTNLLLPLLNVGIEVALGNRWSIGVDHYYPWLWRFWPTKSNKYCYELSWEQLEVRYWFGDDHKPGCKNWKHRLQGHSMAIFGAGGYYDIEKNWSGNQGEFWAGGIDWLYSKPVWHGKAHLQFSLGVGFMTRQERAYDVFEDGGLLIRRRVDEKRHNYFGPLKANITLAFPLYRRAFCNKCEGKEVAL